MKQNNELTERESQVLEQMFLVFSNKQIAENLHISLHTVKAHALEIYKKLNSKNKLEAVLTGLRRGYLHL